MKESAKNKNYVKLTIGGRVIDKNGKQILGDRPSHTPQAHTP